MFKKAFAILQQLGKSLMLPVSVLPVAGILLGLGSARLIEIENIQKGVIQTAKFWFLPDWLAYIMKGSGDAIFGNLPLIFAIAVAIGFTGNDGAAAVAAIVGFVVFLATMGAASVHLFGVNADDLSKVMGISTLDTGVFGGLIIGGIAAYMFNRFFRIQLPQYLGFFAGKRSVPILTALVAIVVGTLMSLIWPPVGQGINTAATAAAAGSNTATTAALYGIVERLLLPFGLHHIWNVPFFFQIGSFIDPITKQPVHGDINRFFAGDPTAGILGGAYWFKMFGLPAAAIAMWHCAYPKNRKITGGIMLSAAFTSFLTGITEPIEFSFMFVAPALYAVHALMAGVCQWLFQTMGGKMGFTFSQGGIDFLLFSGLPNAQKVWLLPVLGLLVFAPLYYWVFRLAIKRFNLKTPGREEEDSVSSAGSIGGASEMARELVRAFGGRGNIETLDACITRLRITVKDIKKVNKDRLKALGASGVLEIGNSAQAIFGPRSENLKTDMSEYLKSAGAEIDESEAYEPNAAELAAAETMPDSASVGTVVHNRSTNGSASDGSITDGSITDGSITGSSASGSAAPQHNLNASTVGDMIVALGGRRNIQKVDAVALTRLRIEVADSNAVNEAALHAAGVQDILRIPGGKLHLIVGLGADQYAEEMQGQLAKA